MKSLKERTTKIIEVLNEGIHERDETIAVSFLAALSDQNVFLFGPPGTAKSLIARRLSHAFETSSYFEYLMHRFSTPEDVFGPVSITELKKDNFIRKTEGFLPRADFAFLDEIWKSSPAILNTLLTITNEKLFRNGAEVESAPLKALIAASNETPPPGQGLEALYDRFLVRLDVSPMEQKENFELLLNAQPTRAKLELPDGLAIKHEEWKQWCEDIHAIKLSQETLNVIHDIRLTFEEKGEELDVYVSDRRWQKAAIFLKAAAFFCEREETNLADTLLLRHCLWTTRENRSEVVKVVEDAVRNCGFETGFSLSEIDDEKEELEREIQGFYYNEDVYETENILGDECFKVIYKSDEKESHQEEFYIPINKMKSKEPFHPINIQGNELKWIACDFGQSICFFNINIEGGNIDLRIFREEDEDYWEWGIESDLFYPKILFHKGDKKTTVNRRRVESLRETLLESKEEIEKITKQIEDKLVQFKEELDNPFVPDNILSIALESVESQLEDMKLRHKNCDRLENLITKISSPSEKGIRPGRKSHPYDRERLDQSQSL